MKRFLSIAISLLLLFSNIPVTANAASDTTAPAITMSETEGKPGDTIKFEIEANDTVSALANSPDNIILIRNRVDGTQAISLHPNYNESTEKYELEYTIPSNMLKGEWYIEKVVLQDNAENKTYFYTNITFTVDSIVIFNSNGGSEVAGLPVKYNEKALAPSEPTKTGYTFGGWYKDNTTFTNLFDFTNTSIIENIELFANWTINNYTISFNSQGGSTVTGKTSNNNNSITTPDAPTKIGYTFAGWYKEAGCINVWDFVADKVTSDTILYAKWTINNYTVIFNSQGGSAVSNKNVGYNTSITVPDAPTKTDYIFGGWYKEAKCLVAWDFVTDKVTKDTILYAKWSQIQRLAGINRIETSIVIAKQQYANKEPDAVVLATANNFADALAGSGLAYKNNAPLLLVNKTVSNSKNVLDYITTNLSENKNIYILGGTGAVSNEISDYLTAKGYKIIRLGGKNRYETNQEIFDYLNTPKGSSIVIATGDNFADALSISSIADIKGFPILLNSKDNLLASVSNDITNIGPTTVYIIGGTGVLSSNIETQIKRLNGKITIVRLGGINRYETSMKILEYFNLNTTTVTVATGIDFPDALSGSVLAARKNCSVLLVDNKNITKQKDLIYKQKITNVIVFGGEGVISNNIATSLIQKPTIATPTSVKAVSSSYNSINISWSGVTGATLYEIYRATSSAGTYTLISTTTGTKYNNAGLTTNSTYYYKVISYRMVGTVKIYSGFSTAVSAKPLLAPPVNVRATRINSNSIKLTWSGVTGANGYEVYRAITSTGTYSILAETAYLYYTNSGLITGKTYYYKMRSYRKVGTTKVYSNWTAATYKATTNIVYNNLVQPNAVYGKYQGLQVEILDQYNYVFLIKKSNGIQMWVASTSVSVASNPATNTKYLDKKQLETYVNITSTFVSNTNYFTWVDLNRQRVSVFSGSAGRWVLLKTYSCATGNNTTPSKRGLFTVQDKGYSFVGGPGVICKYWTRYSGNYLLHSVLLNTSGSIYDGTVGKRASHGCIRMPLDMAKWYYEKIPRGSLIWVN